MNSEKEIYFCNLSGEINQNNFLPTFSYVRKCNVLIKLTLITQNNLAMTDSDTFFHFDNTHQPDQFPELYREKSFEGFPNQDSQHFIPPESNLDNLFQYVPESDSYEPTEHRNVETLSNYSASSTNCSSKLSPPYNQGEEDHKDPKGNKDSAPILKKKIHKYYEPIKDGNVTYRYEDDPVEYKKARK